MYRVFLIDDEAWALISLERLISWNEYGFEICGKAENAKKAWNSICSCRPDVIITDIRMPGMSGIELLQKIRENEMDIAVILVSGFAEFEYAQEAVRQGAFEYLLKQVKREELIDCMERLYLALEEKKGLKSMKRQFLARKLYQTRIEDAVACIQQETGRMPGTYERYFAAAFDRESGKTEPSDAVPYFTIGPEGNMLVMICGLEREKELSEAALLLQNLYGTAGFSREAEGGEKTSALIREARIALESARFTHRKGVTYHPAKAQWSRLENMISAIRFRNNNMVRSHIDMLSEAVSAADILIDELFKITERIAYEYFRANNTQLQLAKNWSGEMNLTESYPDAAEFFAALKDAFPTENEQEMTYIVMGEIEKHIADGITLAAIGKKYGMSQAALSQLIKKQTGKTWSELISQRRVEKAKELLLYSDKTVTEIAYEAGYTDPFYFSKTFKKLVGIPPNEYRRQHGKREK